MKASSHWLIDAEPSRRLFDPLQSDLSVDVAIVGGGFVGIWTAITLKHLEPSLRVAVLERSRCGGGASGLNGGFVMSWWPKISSLVKACGQEDALWLARETTRAVVDLESFTASNGIDAQYRRSGWLWTATAPAHIGAWNGVVDLARRFGHDEVFSEIDPVELKHRTGSRAHLAGIIEPINATVHPGVLGCGLAAVAERNGVLIFENTPVTYLERHRPAGLRTPGGTVTAERVVIASNAWAASIPELSRYFVCVGSAVVATPPIPERLKAIGWTGGESITDSQATVTYYRATRDGRIIFGKGGVRVYYTGEPSPSTFNNESGKRELVEDFRRVYPMLKDVPIDRSWCGPIDRTYDGLPLLGTLPGAPHIAYGVGWSGNGVNPSRIGGRILAGLALERKERWTSNGLVNRQTRRFPPEPFRYLGGELVRSAMMRRDRAELAQRKPARLDVLLTKLAPAGLEDKN